MSGRIDPERVAAMSTADLWRLAERLGVPGARWLPRAALERGVLAMDGARRAWERARETVAGLKSMVGSGAPPELSWGDSPRSRVPAPEPATDPDVPPPSVASETIARLYEAQGKPQKARAVRRIVARRDQVRVEISADPTTLTIRWRVGARAWRGAELRLGAAGRRMLRVVATGPDRAPDLRDLPIDVASGRASLARPRAAFVRAAVGLRADDGRFVPAAHSDTVAL